MGAQVPVGIVDLERYLPEGYLGAADIAERSGIPADVITDKFGLTGKHVSETNEHVSDMCISAAKGLLERNDPSDIDAVVYFGSHWKDYLVWNVAPKIQRALGIEGFSLEVINVSAGAPIALKVVGDMMRSDPAVRRVLMVAASKEGHLLDYSDERSRFAFNFSDGAVAVLLERGLAINQLLGTSIYTDGSFSDHVAMFGGGSANPASASSVAEGMHHLAVIEGAEMKERLDPITVKNFIKVVRESLDRSGYTEDDIDLLLPIHFKRSLHSQILIELGLPEEKSIYLSEFGHMSAVDPLLSLSIAREGGRLSDGDVVVLLAAGTGYTWAASTLRWGVSE